MASKLAKAVKMKMGKGVQPKLTGESEDQYYGHMRESKMNSPKKRTKAALTAAFARHRKG